MLGVEARSFLTPGTQPGSADLLVKVEESRPYRFSFDADNFGSRFTGRNRFGLNGEVGNLMKFGDRLSLRVVRSDLGQNFVNLSYSVPITSDGMTGLGFSYIFANHTLGANLTPLEGEGEAKIFTIKFSHTLLRTRSYEVNVSGGVDFRSFTNSLLGSVTSDDSMADAFLGLRGFVTDRFLGRTYYNVRAQVGDGERDVGDKLNSRFLGRGDRAVVSGGLTR